MKVNIRRLRLEDIPIASSIIQSAFNEIYIEHGIPRLFDSLETVEAMVQSYFYHDPEGCLVAEADKKLKAAGFVHIRDDIASLGPLAVDISSQSSGVGRKMMLKMCETAKKSRSIRLTQDAFNTLSFSLYSKLGFAAKDIVVFMYGKKSHLKKKEIPQELKKITFQELEDVSEFDKMHYLMERKKDLQLLMMAGASIYIAGKKGDISGYLTFFPTHERLYIGPGVSLEPEIMESLLYFIIKIIRSDKMISLRLPANYFEILKNFLDLGFKVDSLETYMVKGEYEKPIGYHLLPIFPEVI